MNGARMTKDFKEALAKKTELELKVDQASLVLKRKYPRTPLGLIPTDIKALAEFKADHFAYHSAFSELQRFNREFLKRFKNEYRGYRAEKYSFS